jgi:predicted 3-demethylubiquinone-9 3-methyltransferase (glyoxalase superfamily)
MDKVTICLWFATEALEAARFYTSIIPASSIDTVHEARADTPGPKTGEVLLVEFTLAGRRYQALNGARHDRFNDAVSLSVRCTDQAEVDRFWDALTADGGKPVACGWLKDKYGLSWQIVPQAMIDLMSDPDKAKSRRVMHALMNMVKLDVAKLEAAARAE